MVQVGSRKAGPETVPYGYCLADGTDLPMRCKQAVESHHKGATLGHVERMLTLGVGSPETSEQSRIEAPQDAGWRWL
jgi:hypothetical protein